MSDCKKVQVGNAKEKAQSERNSHSKNRSGKNLVWQLDTYAMNIPTCLIIMVIYMYIAQGQG